jgi:hypothetical protein
LEKERIEFYPIMSSKDHYWFVTDFVGSFKECIDLYSSIPGIDKKHLSMAKSRGLIQIRATPAHGSTFRPKFPEKCGLKNSLAIKWVEEFKAFHSQTWNTAERIAMQKAVESGELYDLLADPESVILK